MGLIMKNGIQYPGVGSGEGSGLEISQLDDVKIIPPLKDGDELIYNKEKGKWVNTTKYHKYSTEEQIVGEWINGKPIYERVIDIENIVLQPYVWTNIYMIENMEKIIDITCIIGTVLNDGRLRWNCLNNYICGAAEENNFTIKSCTFIVKYIKTTD